MKANIQDEQKTDDSKIVQYSLKQIILVWVLATVPMGVLGWIVAPFFSSITDANPAIMRIIMLSLGLLWQFILVLILMKRETGDLKIQSLKRRLWLKHPTNPITKKIDKRMYWFTLPLLVLSAINSIAISPKIDKFIGGLVPILSQPDSINIDLFIENSKSSLVGAWWFLALFIFMSVLNTFLGEELLFRGVLLPRSKKIFKKFDWVVIGVLFALYHVSMPWTIVSTLFLTTFTLTLPSRLFKSSWFGIIVHSGQTIFFVVIFLGLILGLA